MDLAGLRVGQMDLAGLRAVRPELLHSGAAAFRRAAQTCTRAADRLETEVLRPLMDGSWSGIANAAAVAYVERVWKDLVRARADLEQAERAVWQFAEAARSAQRMVGEAEHIVESAQLVLAPDGSIQVPPLPGPTTEDDAQLRQRAAEQAHSVLGEALRNATEADLTCAKVLAELVADHAGGGGVGGGVGGGGGFGNDGVAPFDDDGSDLVDFLGTVVDGLSWAGTVSSFVEANWGIGGLGSLPVLGPVLGPVLTGVGLGGALYTAQEIVAQGNPIDAYQENGAEYAADWLELGFNASSVAFALAPDPFSKLILGGAVVTTGIGWAAADNWNSIPFHDNIEDAAETYGEVLHFGWQMTGGTWSEAVPDVVGEAWENAGDMWDAGTDAAGTMWSTGTATAGDMWETGTDAAGAMWDTGTDALGGLASTGADLLGL